MCVSKPANKGEAGRHTERTLTPGATATITPSLQGTKSGDQNILQQTSGELPIAKDSYGAEEVQKPRAARSSLDARRQGTSSAEPAEVSVSPEDGTDASSSDVEDPQLMKEYIRLAEMLRYSPYPVSLIAIEEDNQPFVFVNNVSSHCSKHRMLSCKPRFPCNSFACVALKVCCVQVFCERLGFTDTDVIGKSWYAVLDPTHQSAGLLLLFTRSQGLVVPQMCMYAGHVEACEMSWLSHTLQIHSSPEFF